MTRTATTLCLVAAPFWAWAQNDTLPEVCVSSSPAPLAARLAATAPSPAESVTGERLAVLGLRGAADALRLMGGVAVRDYGGLGGLQTVSVRGLGAEHTAVLCDGLPVTDTQGGQIDLSRFPTDNVGQLRLHIGEDADLLAPAMLAAYSGGIHLRTAADAGRTASRVQAAYGEWNTLTASATLGVPLPGRAASGVRHALVLHAYGRHSDGDYPFTLVNGQERERLRRDGGRVDAFGGELNHRAEGRAWCVQSKLYAHRSDRGLPGAVIYYVNEGTERLWDTDLAAQSRVEFGRGAWRAVAAAKYAYAWTKYHDARLAGDGDAPPTGGAASASDAADGAHSDVIASYDRVDDVITPGGVLATYRYRQHTCYATASLRWQPGGGPWALAAAHDGQWATLASNLPECPYPVRHTTWTQLRTQFHTAPLTVQAALLLTTSDERRRHRLPVASAAARGETQPLADGLRRWTPSVAASWQPLRALPLRLRASWRKALRLPSFNDLYYDRFGNHGLRPERADEANVGLTLTAGRGAADAGWQCTLTADAYHNRVADKIVAYPTTFAWRMANFGRAALRGVDVGLALAASTRRLDATASAHYTLSDATDRTGDATTNRSYAQPLPYTPRHSGNAAATLAAPWLTVGYTLTWQGERHSNPMATARYRLAPYAEHSVTASHTFRLRGRRPSGLDVGLACRNLADAHYDVIQFYPMPGRQFELRLRYDFNLL